MTTQTAEELVLQLKAALRPGKQFGAKAKLAVWVSGGYLRLYKYPDKWEYTWVRQREWVGSPARTGYESSLDASLLGFAEFLLAEGIELTFDE